MRVVVIADDDSLIGKMEPGNLDVLISLGNLWDATLRKAAELYRPREVLAVRGNHDSAAPFEAFVNDLHLHTVTIDGVVFGGFGGSWRYKPRGHHLFDQEEVLRELETFQPVDVFVAHNSPRGIHERDEEVHQGFDGLLRYIERVQPSYLLHGHQHLNAVMQVGATRVIGIYGEALLELQPRKE